MSLVGICRTSLRFRSIFSWNLFTSCRQTDRQIDRQTDRQTDGSDSMIIFLQFMKFNIQKHFYSTKCTTTHGLGEKADPFYKCTVYICINYLSTPLSIKPKFKRFRCFVVFGIIYQLVDNDETVAQVTEDFVLNHLLIHSLIHLFVVHSFILFLPNLLYTLSPTLVV